MLRRVSLKACHLRRLYSECASVRTPRTTTRNGRFIASSSVIAATLLWYSTKNTVHSDAPPYERVIKTRDDLVGLAGTLGAVVWGSNKSNVISPQNPGVESIRTPAAAGWLQNVALRDLALHENHAACVDAHGDLYQWGDGFFGSSSDSVHNSQIMTPKLTLHGKNVVRLELTDSRVFALSASGRIYVLAAESSRQSPIPGQPTPSSSPWYRPGWLLGKQGSLDFTEIQSKDRLSWGEKFVAISAGSDHLLALTSSGRTFAYPISKLANSHGQLGFRKFDIPVRSSEAASTALPSRLPVELIPLAIVDPYARSSSLNRPATSSSSSSDILRLLDDQDIRFSDTLFEIPGLKGIKITQVVAGGRTSFVKTDTGKVLGWGANENAQIGLGNNVTSDTITVPTEVVLWRTVPNKTRSKCLDICTGGNLTCFIVERTNENDISTVDLLMCGDGQWGGLGNNKYSNAQGNPVRAKSVSGLLEYSEKEQKLQPIMPHAISVSPTGHVLLTLDTLSRAGPGGGGRDLLVWGANQQYELGNGKRASLAVPTPLQQEDGSRFMLMKTKADVKDMQGKLWNKGIEIEQCAVAGYKNSMVYWKICRSP